jgi:isopenicillin-N N-acyltransferase like protein
MAQQLQALYGGLTPENTISNVTALVQTGDLHIAVYDLTDNTMHVSFAASDTAGARAGGDAAARAALRAGVAPKMAYDRPFTRVDMTSLFAEPPPAAAEAA